MPRDRGTESGLQIWTWRGLYSGIQGLTFGLEEAKGPGSHGSCSVVSLRTPQIVSAQVPGLTLEFFAQATVWVF